MQDQSICDLYFYLHKKYYVVNIYNLVTYIVIHYNLKEEDIDIEIIINNITDFNNLNSLTFDAYDLDRAEEILLENNFNPTNTILISWTSEFYHGQYCIAINTSSDNFSSFFKRYCNLQAFS